ncbi:MAG: hypothetical protein JNN27_06670 [Planctomycetes bacterium]|nr:hypothetical protein [Planctomycetota bacterium]
MESEPDEIDSEIDSEHESRPRHWRFWLRTVALTILVGGSVATFVLEGDARRIATLVSLSALVLATLVITMRVWSDSTFEERCRSVGAVAFYAAWLVCSALEVDLPTVVQLGGVLAYALVLCVDMYRSLDAARPSYGSPPLRAGRAGGRTNFPGAPADGTARRSP